MKIWYLHPRMILLAPSMQICIEGQMISYNPSMQILGYLQKFEASYKITKITRQISHKHGSSIVSLDKALLKDTCSANSFQKIGCKETGIPFSIFINLLLLHEIHIPPGKLSRVDKKSGYS